MPNCVGRVLNLELYMTWSPEGREDENTMLESSLFRTLNSEKKKTEVKRLKPKWNKLIKNLREARRLGNNSSSSLSPSANGTITERTWDHNTLKHANKKLIFGNILKFAKESLPTSSWPARKETELWSIVTQGFPRTPGISCTFLSSVQRAFMDTCIPCASNTTIIQ